MVNWWYINRNEICIIYEDINLMYNPEYRNMTCENSLVIVNCSNGGLDRSLWEGSCNISTNIYCESPTNALPWDVYKVTKYCRKELFCTSVYNKIFALRWERWVWQWIITTRGSLFLVNRWGRNECLFFYVSMLSQMGISTVGRTLSSTSGGLFKSKDHLHHSSASVMELAN